MKAIIVYIMKYFNIIQFNIKKRKDSKEFKQIR